MSYELFLLRLVSVLSLSFSALCAEETQLFISSEKVLEAFFKHYFENTTAGYTIYGEKPVDLEWVSSLDKTIPGSKEREVSVTSLLALKYWKKIARIDTKQNYILADFSCPNGHELIFINRKAFLSAIKESLLLFEYKFGLDINPEWLLLNLIQNGFSHLFKENIALQGIVLGYGIENAISYESGTTFLKMLKPPILPPNQLSTTFRNPEAVLSKIKDKKRLEQIQELTCYKSAEKNDRVKVPFSYLKNSKKSSALLSLYKRYQKNIEGVLKKKRFLSDVLSKFEIKFKSQQIDVLHQDSSISKIIAQSIVNTFPEEISHSFYEGMKAAERQEEAELADIRFLDILWKRDRSQLQQTNEFFSSIIKNTGIDCLIPGKLYTRQVRKSRSNTFITKNYTSIRVQYMLKDLNDNPLVGSYQMEEPPVLNLNEIIPGLYYGLLGMKEGEIREIFIHPDFVYGTGSDFGNGQAIKATVELIELGERQDHVNAPFLQPIDVADFSPEISSCAEFVEFQKKHAYACGFRSWSYYKNTGCSLELVLNNMAEYSGADLSESDEELLLKLEWLLFTAPLLEDHRP